jgi:peptidoglycan-associated lipoprotein
VKVERETVAAKKIVDSIANADAAAIRADSTAIAAAARTAAAAAQAAMKTKLTVAIDFEPDSSNIYDNGITALDHKTQILLVNPSVTLRITGHAYEAASDKDNVALGLRRATVAKQYLVVQGVAADHIEVVGVADPKPAASDDPNAGAPNRRAAFEVTTAPPTLKVP